MPTLRALFVSAVLVAGCKGSEKEKQAELLPQPTEKAVGCSFLPAAKVQSITGVAVAAHGHGNPQSCALFKAPDGNEYLLVSTASASAYELFVDSTPKDMFPFRAPVPGIGDEAIMLRTSDKPDALRMLIARNSARSVVLTPMYNQPISDAHLTELGRAAMSAQ